jgi:copper oxidase (laccase) domain-containing protein
MSSVHNKSVWANMAYSKIGNGHKCVILGRQPRLSSNPVGAFRAAIELGATPDRICLLHVPSNQNESGFQLIEVASYDDPVEAEGVILTERGSSAILQTADCPTIILTDEVTGNKVVTHAGRGALTPQSHSVDDTIVETALTQLGAKDKTKVHAFVAGDISGKHFLHDHESARALIEPFLCLGDEVFTDKERFGLSLFAVIKHRLLRAGVPLRNISHYGDCTFDHQRYSSHRRDGDRNDRNHIIVVKTR